MNNEKENTNLPEIKENRDFPEPECGSEEVVLVIENDESTAQNAPEEAASETEIDDNTAEESGEDGGGVSIELKINSVVNFALEQNGFPIVQSLVLRNDSARELRQLELKYRSEPEIVISGSIQLDYIGAGASFSPGKLNIGANGAYLSALSERIKGRLYITLSDSNGVLAECSEELTALAFDEWHGSSYYPELLASFVTPNSPEIAKILASASKLLEKWGKDPSLDAYQTQNPNRVLAQAGAIYGAIQILNISYCVPPASFEELGQRVRLCDALVSQKLGTCLDIALLYASCLEAAGLHPLLILQPGHAFAGLWLEDMSFPEAVQDDVSLLTKRLADGVAELAVVECTAPVAGKDIDFDGAVKLATDKLRGGSFDYVIDVSRARLSGIRPLPLRIKSGEGWSFESNVRGSGEITKAPSLLGDTVPELLPDEKQPIGKLAQWERKLLDLGLRNSLINLRPTKSNIPMLTASLAELEDALSNGSEYSIGARPAEWDSKGGEQGFEAHCELGECVNLINSELGSKRLRSSLTEAELDKSIKNIYRTAKLSIEENGANTLYFALGLLRWYETAASQKPRYAPIVLLPVDIVRKSASRGYIVRLRDDDPQMNITLLEMLKQDFGITAAGLDPLPLDAQGIDMRTVFSVLRRAVMEQRRWDVVETAVLGIFSFSQFVMWNDVRNRSDELAKNKIVKSLIDSRLTWDASEMSIGGKVPEDGAFLPLPADASQLFAIEEAARGESFVLHGPPGTGKSQTITAMIANALAQGETVLFVAEKMAALSVVQRRLDNIGIGAFCLELHSNKSQKKDLLAQLRSAMEVTKLQPADVYEKKAQQAAKTRAELDCYSLALHKKRGCGLSLYELVGRWEQYRGAREAFRFSAGYDIDAAALERQRETVSALVAAAKELGSIKGHPLLRVKLCSYSRRLRSELPELLEGYKGSLDLLDEAGEELCAELLLRLPLKQSDWEKLNSISSELGKWDKLPRAWAQLEDADAAMCDIIEMSGHYLSALGLKAQLLEDWDEGFLEEDGAALEQQWLVADQKWFLPDYIGKSKLAKPLRQYSKGKLKIKGIEHSFALLREYQSELAAGEALLGEYSLSLEDLLGGEATDWQNISTLAETAKKSAALLDELSGGTELRQTSAALEKSVELAVKFKNAFAGCEERRGELYSLLEIAPLAGDAWLAGEKKLCTDIDEGADSLKEWLLWNSLCVEARELQLEPFVKAYENGLDNDEAQPVYERALCKALIDSSIDADEVLSGFSGAAFNEKISQLRRLDKELTELAKVEIYCRLASRVPNFTQEAAQSSELGILQKAVRSSGRGLSIRKLFELLPNLLPRLCPCMLMSPISAAQYLSPDREPFDVVIFDEASQLPTCKAVGALARGKSAVIVGDPNQMPPTSFFMSSAVDEENLLSEDLESILDDCLSLGIPQTKLLWHYRSRHESLIAFSNSRFYENRLFTFPSVNDRESKVKLVKVDGVFERGKNRQNRAEAQAVIDELKARCRDEKRKGQSVGIVTFNIMQQNLIDDLLNEACGDDPELESWAFGAEEPIFIKNLENVQGDERDAILFSIGYGPDENGKVFMNFGPLNRSGGWRRLNVAVSRARQEMTVFSTLTPEQIDLSRSSSDGVAALKAFLEYADSGRLTETAESGGISVSGPNSASLEICERLKADGYETKTMVGRSEYRIDIGVVDPENPDRYLLGILLDGSSYKNAKTTRDREIAQLSVLSGLGWDIVRIWTVDWWDNSDKEYSRLLERIESAKKGRNPALSDRSDAAGAAIARRLVEEYKPKGEEQPLRAEPYSCAELPQRHLSADEFLLPEREAQIRTAIKETVAQEAPISKELLTKRVLQSFGIARSGSRIQECMERNIKAARLKSSERNGQIFYWSAAQKPLEYKGFRASGEDECRRELKDLPIEEAVNAVNAVLSAQISLPREDLAREAAKLLGYMRPSAAALEFFDEAIELAEKSGNENK